MKDEEIVQLFWESSERAIDETKVKYSRYLYVIAFRLIRNHEDAEECVNETFYRAWNAIPPARPSMLRTFLGKIIRNLSLNVLEKKRASKRSSGGEVDLLLSELDDCIPDAHRNVEESIDEAFLIETVNDFLDVLNITHRKIFVQRYWYGLSIREIKEEFGFTESKVKSILYRLRIRLRSELEKEGILL